MYQKVRKKHEWTEDVSSWLEDGEDDWEQPLQPRDAWGASRVYQEMEQQLCTPGRKFCLFHRMISERLCQEDYNRATFPMSPPSGTATKETVRRI